MSSLNLQRKVISFSRNFSARLFTIFFILFFFHHWERINEFHCGPNVEQFVWEELNSNLAINGEILPLRSLIAFFVDEYSYFSIF